MTELKILHVLDHSAPIYSGYTFRTLAIIEEQKKLGWKTFHLTSPKHNLAHETKGLEEDIQGVHFYRTAPYSGLFSKLPVWNQWKIVTKLEERIEEIINHIRPDIIHAHSPALNGLAAVKVGKRHNIPVVYEIRAFWEDAAVSHGTTKEGSIRYYLSRLIESYVIKKSNAITTICEGLKNDIVNRCTQKTKVTVIPNAVNISKFGTQYNSDKLLKKQYGLTDKIVLGFIGSFYAYEGLMILIRAMSKILCQDPTTCLLLVGGGPQKQEIINLVNGLNLINNVIFTGYIPHDKVQAIYNLIDIFIYPRLSMRLTELVTPLKPLEAMAQKRLVVASDVGGHKELIKDGDTGVLFKAGNYDALADVVLNLLKRVDSWDIIRSAGRHFVETERNWQSSVSRYQKVYQQARDSRGNYNR